MVDWGEKVCLSLPSADPTLQTVRPSAETQPLACRSAAEQLTAGLHRPSPKFSPSNLNTRSSDIHIHCCQDLPPTDYNYNTTTTTRHKTYAVRPSLPAQTRPHQPEPTRSGTGTSDTRPRLARPLTQPAPSQSPVLLPSRQAHESNPTHHPALLSSKASPAEETRALNQGEPPTHIRTSDGQASSPNPQPGRTQRK